jgi:hypothetical protein
MLTTRGIEFHDWGMSITSLFVPLGIPIWVGGPGEAALAHMADEARGP